MKWIFLILFILFNFSLTSYAVMRDPTRPVTENNETEQELFIVNAIIISANTRAAVINGQMVKEGDVVGGTRIIKIESNKVEIEQDNVKSQLFLVNKPIKRRLLDAL